MDKLEYIKKLESHITKLQYLLQDIRYEVENLKCGLNAVRPDVSLETRLHFTLPEHFISRIEEKLKKDFIYMLMVKREEDT